jgi:MoaA/NifB/PqqE/SkfB family radical SAM enzyme
LPICTCPSYGGTIILFRNQIIDITEKPLNMNLEQKYLDAFQNNLDYFFYKAVDINLSNLRQCGFWIKTMNHQNHAAEVRQKRLESGLPAPPVMICSITSRCNLKCRGCYAMAKGHMNGREIPAQRFESLVREASAIGTNIILLAGGEPLLRRDILESAGRAKETIFPVFTNGTLLDGDYIRFFKKNRNLLPVLSIEGDRQRTDDRRGKGLYATVLSAAEVLRRSKMFYGLSLTLTQDNFDELTDPGYLGYFHKRGCRLFFLVEYVPQTENDMHLCISEQQQNRLPGLLGQLREKLPALFICLPGEEDQYGGCLAAGRGFIHVSPTGDLEPCPFAPYSDTNIMEMPLKDALNSVLLGRIRDSHHLLTESKGGCTLWENREWVEMQMEKPGSLRA